MLTTTHFTDEKTDQEEKGFASNTECHQLTFTERLLHAKPSAGHSIITFSPHDNT